MYFYHNIGIECVTSFRCTIFVNMVSQSLVTEFPWHITFLHDGTRLTVVVASFTSWCDYRSFHYLLLHLLRFLWIQQTNKKKQWPWSTTRDFIIKATGYRSNDYIYPFFLLTGVNVGQVKLFLRYGKQVMWQAHAYTDFPLISPANDDR